MLQSFVRLRDQHPVARRRLSLAFGDSLHGLIGDRSRSSGAGVGAATHLTSAADDSG